MIRRPPRSTPLYSSAASDVYKRQIKIVSITTERRVIMKLMRAYVTILFFIVDALHAQEVVNGNFDLGRNNGWTDYSKGNFTLIGTGPYFASTDITPPVTPHSGQYMGLSLIHISEPTRLGMISYAVF